MNHTLTPYAGERLGISNRQVLRGTAHPFNSWFPSVLLLFIYSTDFFTEYLLCAKRCDFSYGVLLEEKGRVRVKGQDYSVSGTRLGGIQGSNYGLSATKELTFSNK